MDIDRFRRRLLALEQELSARIERENAIARDEVPRDVIEAGDRGIIDELKDEAIVEGNIDVATLAQVREALKRIEDGTFGRCVVDGEPIDEKRLEAIPWTPYCLRHQQELEAATPTATPTL